MRLFVLIGGLLVVVLMAALLAPLFVNWSDYKSRFEAEATRLLGQPVRVAGEATARILPFPSVSFSDVEVGPPEAPVIVAERFSLDVELAPFLSGDVLIFDMRLVDPVVTVTLDANGAVLWSPPETRLIDPAQITLENATVENGTLIVLDPAHERRWTVSDLDMAVSANSYFGPWRAEGTARLEALPADFVLSTGQFTREGFSLRVAANLPDQLVRIVSDGRVARDEAGQVAYAGALTLLPHRSEQSYRIEGDFAATARAIDISAFRGAFGNPEDPYTVTGSAALFGGAEPGYRLTARGTQVNVPVGADEAETGTAMGLGERLSAVNAVLAGLPWPSVPGTVNLDLPAIVVGDTTMRDVRLIARPEPDGADRRHWRIDRLDAHLPGRTALEADGLLTLPRPGAGMDAARFSGDLVIASRQPSGLARWLAGTVDEPIRRLSGTGISAAVSLDAERQVAENVVIMLDGARLTGRLARRGGRTAAPYMTVDLAGGGMGWPTLEALASIFGAEAGGLALGGHDIDIALALDDVDLGGVPAATLEAAIRARGARTEVDRLIVTGVHGASITGAGAVERLEGADLAVTFDASVLAAAGAPFVTAMAERFAGLPLLDHLALVARRDRAALLDTQLTVVGSARTTGALARLEASASVSGEAGGTGMFAQASLDDALSTGAIDAFAFDGSLTHDDALRLLPVAGVPLMVDRGASVGLIEPGEARFSLRRADGRADAIALMARAGSDTLSFKGELAGDDGPSRFAGDLVLALADAEPWLAALGHALPGTGLGTPVDARAALGRSDEVWRFDDLSASIAGSAVTGDLTYTGDAVLGPSLHGALHASALDAMFVAGLLTGHVDPLGADTPFGAPLHGDLGVRLDLSADRLLAGPVVLEDAGGRLTMDGGLMVLQDLGGRHGARTAVAGDLRVQNAGGAISLGARVDLRGAPLGDLVAMAVPVAGTADLALTLTGGGDTFDTLGASLTGTGVAAVRDVAVAGLDAGAMASILAAADAIGFGIEPAQIEAIVGDALFAGGTGLGGTQAPVTVTGGVARIASLALASPDGALTLNGDVALDLIGRAPGALVTVMLDPGDEAIAGMAPALDLAVEMEAGGDLSLAADMRLITAYLIQRALEIEQARIERLQVRLLERQRLRRELRHARYMRTQESIRRNEERLRAIGRKRLEALRAAERRAAQADALGSRLAPHADGLDGLGEGMVLRAPLPPPGADFSEEAVRSLIEGPGR